MRRPSESRKSIKSASNGALMLERQAFEALKAVSLYQHACSSRAQGKDVVSEPQTGFLPSIDLVFQGHWARTTSARPLNWGRRGNARPRWMSEMGGPSCERAGVYPPPMPVRADLLRRGRYELKLSFPAQSKQAIVESASPLIHRRRTKICPQIEHIDSAASRLTATTQFR